MCLLCHSSGESCKASERKSSFTDPPSPPGGGLAIGPHPPSAAMVRRAGCVAVGGAEMASLLTNDVMNLLVHSFTSQQQDWPH